ncbi:MAG TPA: hypothetical protein VMY42_04325 [Thermoguttaceae bacterium]|nr:hypothetical protein [Thermoguttaceae bacterium]
MAPVSRTAQLGQISKVLKRHYKPVAPDPDRPVLEHLLFACCLENAHYEAAEEVFAALVHTFFDWNEMRVTSIAELSEIMAALPDPRAAANRFKRVLQSVFEATYCFDLEEERKKNLGPTVKWFQKLDGTTNFTVAYLVQAALGGHAIPIDAGVSAALHVVELVTDEDVAGCVVPGLERAIPKAKGIEFGSMLHQFGADFTANPYSPAVRKILLQINPDAQDRLPKRRSRKKPPEKATQQPAESAEAEPPSSESKRKSPKSKGAASEHEKSDPADTKNRTLGPKKSSAREKTDAEKTDAEKTPPESQRKKGKSTSEGLAKRKPR